MPREPDPPPPRVLPLLLVGYAATYLCRANVEPAFTLLSNEHGYDNEQTGLVLGIALAAYAAGKLVLGPLSDLKGGKRVLVGTMIASACASLVIALLDPPQRFGAGPGLVVIGALLVVNRFVQAGGWGGLVHVVGRFFGPEQRGTVMGILSTSYDVGNVATLALCWALVHAGAGWRTLFVVNPIVLGLVAVVVRFALPEPGRIVVPDLSATQRMRAMRSEIPGEPLPAIAKRLGRSPSFWFAFALSFLLTFVRAGFMTWTPRFLYEVSVAAHVEAATSSSIAKSAFFGMAGIVGSVVTGRLSDRLGPGRRAPLMTVSLLCLVVCVVALAHAGVTSPLLATIGVGACGLFLLGPYSLLGGAVSLDVGGARGAATAAGFIDAIGYVGATLAAIVLGSVSKRLGWTAAFDVVAAVTLAAFALSTIWSYRSSGLPASVTS